MSQGIGPVTVAVGVMTTITTGPRTGTSQVVLYNESQNLLRVSGGRYNGYQIPAWTGDLLDFSTDSSYSGSISVTPLDISNLTSPPSTVVGGNIYSPGEPVTGTYPVALVRQTSVGGGALSGASNLVNDGNGLQNIIESTIAGNATGISNVSVNNDGTFAYAVQAYSAYQKVLQLISGGSGAAELSLNQTFLAIADTNSGGSGFWQLPIFIFCPDTDFRAIHWNSPTKEIIDWTRAAGSNLAFLVSREAANGFTAKTLFQVDTTGVPSFGGEQVLLTGNQETGYCALRFKAAAAADNYRVGVNFKNVMTNVPSSITLTTGNHINDSSHTAQNITQYGFELDVAATAAGFCEWWGSYTTVGN